MRKAALESFQSNRGCGGCSRRCAHQSNQGSVMRPHQLCSELQLATSMAGGPNYLYALPRDCFMPILLPSVWEKLLQCFKTAVVAQYDLVGQVLLQAEGVYPDIDHRADIAKP